MAMGSITSSLVRVTNSSYALEERLLIKWEKSVVLPGLYIFLRQDQLANHDITVKGQLVSHGRAARQTNVTIGSLYFII